MHNDIKLVKNRKVAKLHSNNSTRAKRALTKARDEASDLEYTDVIIVARTKDKNVKVIKTDGLCTVHMGMLEFAKHALWEDLK